jgi:flagellar basal-body rod protein FlgG
LARFVNKEGLDSIGDNLFVETAASGQPTPARRDPKASATCNKVIWKKPTSMR